MRGPSKDELLKTDPPELRVNTKIGQALLDLRRKILTGELSPGLLLTTAMMKESHKLNNIETQTVFLRLAIEGLVKVSPAREKTWPNYAAYNEYRVADWAHRDRMLSTRHGDFVRDIGQNGHPASKKTLKLEIEYADEEIASLLNISISDPVVYHRNLQYRDDETVVAICDSYFPFWFAPMMPRLKEPDSDIYELMRQVGKDPQWATETTDIVQASSVERVLFGLSPDDPSGLFKILRRSFDLDGNPMEVQYLTDRGDIYRLHHSFPLYSSRIPDALQDK